MDIDTAMAFTDALVFAKAGVHLSDLQQAMLRASWSMQRQSYDQIAQTYGYSSTYLKHDVGPKLWKLLSEVLGEKVNKTSFRTAIERHYQAADAIRDGGREQGAEQGQGADETADQKREQGDLKAKTSPGLPRQDWGSAPDVSFFYGREAELAQLWRWIGQDRCRLVAVLGMGGMGKTSLSAKLAQQLISANLGEIGFDLLIWRSLRNAPPLQDLLADLLHGLSHQQETAYPETVEGKIERVLYYLRAQRCLIVLDNMETVLQAGRYPAGEMGESERHDAWGELLRQVGETVHQSCLVITSREKPDPVALLEGVTLPVRTLALTGLPIAAGQQLCQLKGTFQGTEAEWQRLVESYSGNPLALKMIATTIQTLFNGSIADFLQQGTYVFGSIRNLMEQQFDRLSTVGRTVMYELAINREASSFAQLRTDIFPPIPPPALIEALEILEQQSLIEKMDLRFSLQPAVMEYVTERLVTQTVAEIQAGVPSESRLTRSHALLKAEAKDYIRDTQIRLILQPILERLAVDTRVSVGERLLALLTSWKHKPPVEMGYVGGNLLNLLLQERPGLEDCDLSYLSIAQADCRTARLKNADLSYTHLQQSLFTETLGIVFTVAFTPDGTCFATGDAEGGLRLRQVANGQLLLNLAGHSGWVWAVAFSPDGQMLASCSSDKTIRLWHVSTGECLQILRGHPSAIWAVAFSPDGTCLASGGDDATIRLWNLETGALKRELGGQAGRILSLAFSPDGQMLVSGSSEGTLGLWHLDAEHPEPIWLSALGDGVAHGDRVWAVAFSPDGTYLASGSADLTVKLWQVSNQTCQATLAEHRDRVRAIAFSPDGNTLVSSSDDLSLRLWRIDSGECIQVFNGHVSSIFSVAFHPGGTMIASGSADQTVRFWNVQTGRSLKTLKGYTNSIFSLAYSPDGQVLASGSTDQTIRLWRSGGKVQTLSGHLGWVTAVAFHPQGQRLASASADRTVRLWSVQTGQCLQSLQGHTQWVQSVMFSPDGELLASAGDDRTIRLWSSRGQCLKVLTGHRSWVWAVRFSPDGTYLASSSDDQTIRLWSVSTGECLRILTGHQGTVQSIAFSQDGQTLVSGSGDETVRLWSVETGDCLRVLQEHQNNVWAVAFSPDGRRVASGSLDQTVRLWEVEQGSCVGCLPVLNQSVRASMAFHPASAELQLATSSQDGAIQIWQVESGQCLQTLLPDRPYQGTNITGITGVVAAQKDSLKRLGAIEF